MRQRLSFGKKYRLYQQQDFRRVMRRGARAGDQSATVYVHANRLPWSRLGIRISRRVGNAVCRNRVKRLIREAFRLARDDLPAGLDVVCTVRRAEPISLEHWRCVVSRLIHAAVDRRPEGDDRS
jgi:ribonuclease P protein component